MIDRNGKLFGKISVIDLAVILLLIAFGIGLFLKFGVNETTSTRQSEAPMTFQLLWQNVRYEVAENLMVGDTLCSEDGSKLGKITDIQTEPAKQTYTDLDGIIKTAEIDQRIDITVIVEGSGVVNSEGKYMLNRNYELNVGASTNYVTKYVSFSGLMQEITWDGAA